jgi:hypothetical protein
MKPSGLCEFGTWVRPDYVYVQGNSDTVRWHVVFVSMRKVVNIAERKFVKDVPQAPL